MSHEADKSTVGSGWRLAMPLVYRITVIAFEVAIETAPIYVSTRRGTNDI